jgi:uncharacterized protein YceH (UPF0502 family)
MQMNLLNWGRSSVLAFVIALLLLSSSAAFAQTQETATPQKEPTEVEQLKKRLQLLEQTVVELKGQIDAIETKK